MRRRPLAAMLVLLSAALVLGGNDLLDAGWGSALRARGLWIAMSAALRVQVQCRREFQEVEHGEDTGSG